MYGRRISPLVLVAIICLQMILVQEHLKPVQAGRKSRKMMKMLILATLMRSKKPKIGILPLPLPLPLPIKIAKEEPPVYEHSPSYSQSYYEEPIHYGEEYGYDGYAAAASNLRTKTVMSPSSRQTETYRSRQTYEYDHDDQQE